MINSIKDRTKKPMFEFDHNHINHTTVFWKKEFLLRFKKKHQGILGLEYKILSLSLSLSY